LGYGLLGKTGGEKLLLEAAREAEKKSPLMPYSGHQIEHLTSLTKIVFFLHEEGQHLPRYRCHGIFHGSNLAL
jgi:hypothetical protein